MAGTILLTILFVLCILLLLPVRAKAFFGDGKWYFSVYYAFIRVFHKESEEKPEPEVPKKPEDLPEGEAPPDPEPLPQPTEKPKSKPKAASANQTVTDKTEPAAESTERVDPELLADTVDTPKLRSKQRKKSAKKQEAEAAEESETKPEQKPRGIKGFIERIKPHSLSDVLGLAQDGFAALTPALKFLTKHLHFRHIRLYLAIGTDDPANTATLYGKICAAAYNLLGAMQSWFDVEADEFRILADFYNPKVTFRGSLELRISPMAAIVLALILGVKFLWRTICRFRREDREAKRREQESAPLSQA